MLLPQEIIEWLKAHGKGDLQECTWPELAQMQLDLYGKVSKLVQHALKQKYNLSFHPKNNG